MWNLSKLAKIMTSDDIEAQLGEYTREHLECLDNYKTWRRCGTPVAADEANELRICGCGEFVAPVDVIRHVEQRGVVVAGHCVHLDVKPRTSKCFVLSYRCSMVYVQTATRNADYGWALWVKAWLVKGDGYGAFEKSQNLVVRVERFDPATNTAEPTRMTCSPLQYNQPSSLLIDTVEFAPQYFAPARVRIYVSMSDVARRMEALAKKLNQDDRRQ